MNPLANVNKAALAAVMLVLAGIGGGMWYKMMYLPAALERTAAEQVLQVEAGKLTTAKGELARIEAEGPDRKSTGEIIHVRAAIPKNSNYAELGIQLDVLAKRAGVRLSDVTFGQSASGEADDTTPGPKPFEVTVQGMANYSGMALFSELVQDMVDENRGKIYIKGRLANVTSLEYGGESTASEDPSDAPPPGYYSFKLTIEAYSEKTDAVGTPTEDTATPGAAGAPGAPTNSSAGGAAPTGTTPDPNATGGQPASTTPPPGTPSTTNVAPGSS